MKLETLPTDELFHIEQRIARRADELLHGRSSDPLNALRAWRSAEREVWTAMLQSPVRCDDVSFNAAHPN